MTIRRSRAQALLVCLLAVPWLVRPALAAPPADGDATKDLAPAFASILEADLLADLTVLTSAPLEGRDSPSLGQTRAAEHIAGRLKAAGLVPVGADGSYLLPFHRTLPAPVPEGCALSGSGAPAFTLGTDFVPVWLTGGSAKAEAVVLGFGIDSDADKYDDIKGDVAGKVAVIVEAEPRHRKFFEGPELSPAADLYDKLEHLKDARVAGALVVRRPPPDQEPADPPALSFRHTWAQWVGAPQAEPHAVDFPVLEVTPAAAHALTGQDVLALAAKVDASGKAPKPIPTGREVTLSAQCEQRDVTLHNVVALLAGTDQKLSSEYVVIGAHYDHLGVDPRGRIGYGADDNASGTAALLEVASALALAPPQRSVLICAFAAEEDGLLGSRALCDKPPVPAGSMVAMLNMDMIGRGPTDTVYVIGLVENPALEKVLARAQKLQPTNLKKVVQRQGQDLFERSDHYSFHKIGVPVLFFLENLPIEKNPDYHTWRDTLDKVDIDKIARTARLVFNTAWLLGNDEARPPPPGH